VGTRAACRAFYVEPDASAGKVGRDHGPRSPPPAAHPLHPQSCRCISEEGNRANGAGIFDDKYPELVCNLTCF